MVYLAFSKARYTTNGGREMKNLEVIMVNVCFMLGAWGMLGISYILASLILKKYKWR